MIVVFLAVIVGGGALYYQFQQKEELKFNIVSGTGTIKYISIEGGFYGLITDDGKKYDPNNLSQAFQKDNLKVKFKARVRDDLVSFHMWGTLVDIIEIEKIETAEIADWQTYRNEEYWFETEFPKDWMIIEEATTDDAFLVTFANSKEENTVQKEEHCLLGIGIYKNDRNLSLNEWAKATYWADPKELEGKINEINFNNQKAIKYEFVSKPAGLETHILFYRPSINSETNKEIISIVTSHSSEEKDCKEMFNQMLSTFRFIEEDETADNWYHITIAKKQAITSDEPTPYLRELFGLPEGKSFSLVYDTGEGDPYETRFDFSYYIFINDQLIKLKDKYENENLIVEVANVDPKLMPYLEDSDYCESNEDCVIRSNFCAYGAFNYYQRFIDVWGCEQGFYPEEDEKSLQELCNKETEHPEVKYTGAKCINHQCVAQGRTVTCVKGVPI